MGWIERHGFHVMAMMLFVSLFASVSASTYISDGIIGDQFSTGRNLLQQQSGCPVDFEFQNYTIITSQCKGPQYPPDLCCPAFKKFACPFAEYINDLSNVCATTMFSYINIHGKYPPGLFASECRDGPDGLLCPALPPSQTADASGSRVTRPSTGLVLVIFFLLLLRLL